MSSNGFSKESSELVKRIRNLPFVTFADEESVNCVNKRNFQSSLNYNKNGNCYVACVTLGRSSYKIRISVQGNRPSPQYEKKIKKLLN